MTKDEVMIPIAEYNKLIIRETVAEAMKQHQESCSLIKTVNDLSHDIWGNGKPGIKEDVLLLKAASDKAELKPVISANSLLSRHLEKIIYIGLITLLSAVMAHFNGGKIPPNIQELLKETPEAKAEK